MTDVTETTSTADALLPPAGELLGRLAGSRVYFDPLMGNNGDHLIEMGSRELLRRAGVTPVGDPRGAAAIVVNGGAGLTPMWQHAFTTVRRYSQEFPSVPLVIMPSSVLFEPAEFAQLFAARTSPLSIYARERHSLALLRQVPFPCEVRLGLDHDTAFGLKGTTFLATLRGRRAERHVLCVERFDNESVTGAVRTGRTSTGLRSLFPESLKRPIRKRLIDPIRNLPRRKVERGHVPLTPMMRGLLDRVYDDLPAARDLPVYSADVSAPAFHSFDEFATLIAQAAAVVTTRLHVAILASMLGKPTYVRPGTFHKIRGIYDFSMADEPHVRLV